MREAISIKIGSLEFTIEEARELYKELDALFGNKLATRPPIYPLRDGDPEYPVITCKTGS